MSPRFVVLVVESRISLYFEIVTDSFCVRCKIVSTMSSFQKLVNRYLEIQTLLSW